MFAISLCYQNENLVPNLFPLGRVFSWHNTKMKKQCHKNKVIIRVYIYQL